MFFAIFQPQSKKKVIGKKVAAAPNIAQKAAVPKKVSNPLFEKRTKNYGIGEFPFLIHIYIFIGISSLL
jgi:hypothetical protein